MTIRIYPSRLPGESLETHEHNAITIHQWMTRNVDNYRADMKHPIAIEVDGVNIPAAAWFDYAISPTSDVRIYPVLMELSRWRGLPLLFRSHLLLMRCSLRQVQRTRAVFRPRQAIHWTLTLRKRTGQN